MEGVENNIIDQENNINQDAPAAEQQSQEPSFEERLISYAKEKGREVSSVEELFTPVEKVVEKEVNPLDGLLDEDDKAYFDFKKETGRGRKEFEALKKNWDEVPEIDLAREKVRQATGLSNLTNEQIDQHIEKKLGISIADMDDSDRIELAEYVRDVREGKKAEQQKYLKPAENKPQTETPKDEMVQLDNGAVMRKTDYEKLKEDHSRRIEQAKAAVNDVTAATFKVAFDDNGTKREEDYTYEYSPEDVQNMASIVSDVDGVIRQRYDTKEGFNHKGFAEGLLWSDQNFREKAVSDMIQKAVARNTEELMKKVGNHSFESNLPIQQQQREGVRHVSFQDIAKLI